ncbi:MAG: 1-acyl-sn-glycerol-3-phosphate acyltransferase, partial [Bacteroidales bacterium]
MDNQENFDDIRPFHDDEVHEVLERLVENPTFEAVVTKAIPFISYEELKSILLKVHSKDEFQHAIMLRVIEYIVNTTSSGIATKGLDELDREQEYLFISNHRDIVLDSALLSAELAKVGRSTCEIAIGDNLLIFPWIVDLVRLNKNFIVRRGVGIRQMLAASKLLSSYIHYAHSEKHQSIWIAQREGRAKDSNDRTQEALIKMLNLGGASDSIIENLKALNISPLSISYEYDPCDYLKAKEFQLKRDSEEYKKPESEDLLNMQTGIMGHKGKIFYHAAPSINSALDLLPEDLDKADMISAVASIIDQAIHSNYHIFPHNYVALDFLSKVSTYADIRYSEEEKMQFNAYVDKQIAKIDIPGKDENFLRERIMEMYANPLKNYLAAR